MTENFTNELKLKKVRRILQKVNDLKGRMEKLSDTELKGQTALLKNRYQKGETLDQLLPEAFATVREASKRVLGKFHYDTQVMGGIVIHQGKIAEMCTGEGKTLVGVLPMYLNALTGKSTILVTMNDYLAFRDGTEMRPLYEYLGLSVGIGVSEDPSVALTIEQKKEVYRSDIVYSTSMALCFDYLIDNLAKHRSEKFMADLHFIIIDEVDSVLLDGARIALRISGAPRVQSNLYETSDYFISMLKEDKDYCLEDKDVYLTKEGIRKAEQFFRLDNLFDRKNFELLRHLYLALRAHTIYVRNEEYVVDDHQIKLLSVETGRIQERSKLNGGQHQALETKEHLPLTQELRAVAAITYQGFFNMIPKIAGMTGSASDAREEFKEIYGLEIVTIPTFKPRQRLDYPDLYFSSLSASISQSLIEIKALHKKGQPVLIVTGSIGITDVYSQFLLDEGIPHNVLNAYNIPKEAEIIREAGQRGAVTVATAVAGRGTDIKLGEGVEGLGGLAVIGIGRMENKRMEVQARGRSGRQGNLGYSRFYISPDDEVIRLHGAESLQKLTMQDIRIKDKMLIAEMNHAQTVAEDQARDGRKKELQYDESNALQRQLIYKMRNDILEKVPNDPKYYEKIAEENIHEYLKGKNHISETMLSRYVLDNISYRLNDFPSAEDCRNVRSAEKYLLRIMHKAIENKFAELSRSKKRDNYLRTMILQAIDNEWIEQVDYLQQLKSLISGRKYAQRNIMHEYYIEAEKSFQRMKKSVRSQLIKNVLLGDFYEENGKTKVLMP